MAGWLTRRRGIVLLLLGVVAALPAYLRAYKINGGSEAPTITIGDVILVNQAAYTFRLPYSNVPLFRTGSIKRGDMVLLALPDRPKRAPKRVIGLPGDSLELCEDRVLLNGRALSFQPLSRADFGWVGEINHIGSTIANEDGHWVSFTPGKDRYRNYPRIQLGPRQYFLIGDNRDVSADSRIWGPVSEDRILGKVIATFHSSGHKM